MKVDKGVCTTNDAYFAGNATVNELNSIIKFETVFTTLVENKILAIKRECEQQDSKKKSRSLKGILSRKPEPSEASPVDGEAKKKKRSNFFLRHKQPKEVDVERGEKAANDEPQAEIAKVDVESDKERPLATSGDEPATLDSQSNEPRVNCDNLVVNSHTDNAQLTLSTTNSSTISNKTIKEPAENDDNDASLATTIDLSLQQSSVIERPPPVSDLAICDDVSSQNTSDIEFSLVSESVSELPLHVRRKTTTNNSDPIVKQPAHFLSPPLTREVKVSDRKAISCQSTPLFGRHQKNEKVLTFQELPKKLEVEKAKSQTIVIAPTSTTTTTTLAKPIPSSSGPSESVHGNRKSQKQPKYRDVSVEYEISYEDNDGNQSPRGFISSFNQLTSQTPPAAVITTNPKRQSLKQTKMQSKAQQDAADDKTVKHHEIELELDDLTIEKRKKRRSESRGTLGLDLITKRLIFHFQGTAAAARIQLFIHLQVGLSTVSSVDHRTSQCKFFTVIAG